MSEKAATDEQIEYWLLHGKRLLWTRGTVLALIARIKEEQAEVERLERLLESQGELMEVLDE